MIKNLAPLALGFALSLPGVALARQATANDNTAVKTVHTVNAGSARRGANSFTERQARVHIARAGFTGVSALTKDATGIWRGSASKGGQQVNVALDFKGNVTTAANAP